MDARTADSSKGFMFSRAAPFNCLADLFQIDVSTTLHHCGEPPESCPTCEAAPTRRADEIEDSEFLVIGSRGRGSVRN